MMLKHFQVAILVLVPGLLQGQDSLPIEPLPYQGNTQDLIFSQTAVFEDLRDLFTLAGRSLPSSVGPISRQEILVYLRHLPEPTSPVEARLRERLLGRLQPRPTFVQPLFLFSLRTLLAPELYAGTVDRGSEWYYGYPERPSAFTATFRSWGGDFAAFALNLTASQEPFAVLNRAGPIATNVPTSVGEWNKYFPSEAWLALGGDFWSFQLGRGELSYGPGRTGNILLSDAADGADFVALAFFWEAFKFHTVVINQDWYEYLYVSPLVPAVHPSGWYRSAEGAQAKSRFQTFHRLEFRILPNLVLALTEAGALEVSGMDFRFFNPFFIYHNWFLSENSDANAALDMEWTPLPGWTVYAAFLADYITTAYKYAVFRDRKPPAYGYQLGTEFLIPGDKALWRIRVEAVWLDRFVYTDRNFNWVQWRRHKSDYAHIRGRALLEMPLGYFLGPDSALIQGALSWEAPGFLKAGLENTWIRKGHNHLRTRNPKHRNAGAPPLSAPPGETPGLSVALRAFVDWELESVGLPPEWVLRGELVNSWHWNLAPRFQEWRIQGVVGARIEL